MRRKLGAVVLGIALLGGLGCSGIGDALLEMSGTEIAMGDDAEHPADFPLPPPSEGELVTSMSMGLAGIETSTVVYKLPTGADGAAILDSYEPVIEEKAGSVTRQERDGTLILTGDLGDGQSLVATLSKDAGESMLSLVSVSKASE